MAASPSINALKLHVNDVIYENHAEEITGPVMQELWHDVIDTIAALFVAGSLPFADLFDDTINWASIEFDANGISIVAVASTAYFSEDAKYRYRKRPADNKWTRTQIVKQRTEENTPGSTKPF